MYTLENWVLCAATDSCIFILMFVFYYHYHRDMLIIMHTSTFQGLYSCVQNIVFSSRYFAFLYFLQHVLLGPDMLYCPLVINHITTSYKQAIHTYYLSYHLYTQHCHPWFLVVRKSHRRPSSSRGIKACLLKIHRSFHMLVYV